VQRTLIAHLHAHAALSTFAAAMNFWKLFLSSVWPSETHGFGFPAIYP
jgi:hypothetical protein